MSKTSQHNKELKAKGKAKPAKAKKAKSAEKTKSSAEQAPNYGRCCTCAFYGHPCRKTSNYVPRKAEKECYKPGPRIPA